jgi:hypothetical protein
MWILRYREELFNVVFDYIQPGGIQTENYIVGKKSTVQSEAIHSHDVLFYPVITTYKLFIPVVLKIQTKKVHLNRAFG